MAFSFDVASGLPRLNQSGTDTSYAGIATAITAQATVARSTAYTVGALVKPPAANGMWYRCSTAGTTSGTAPLYNPVDASTTTDGTAVFTALLAPIVRTLGTSNNYYMPAFRVQIQGTLTNTNPQQENFTCSDVIIFGGNWTSGAWATDGVTPRWDGLHFAAVKVGANNADPTCLSLQSGAQFTFIGGEVQIASACGFDSGTTPRSYQTRWRNTKEWGASSSRIRSYTTNAIFTDCEFFDVAYDLFRMPTVAPSIKARGSEYLFQYVGSGAGGADAKFSASALENVDGTYDFDNYFGGWVELYNCKAGESLKVYSQHPSSSIWSRHCVPLYQDIRITAKDTTGALLQNVRFNCTDSPANSPTVTFTTVSALKTWDFRNSLSYETTTNASGIALSTPVLNVWYWQTSFKENLRFPLSTATYQGRAYNYKTMNVSVVLGSNSIQDVSAGMIGLDTATTVTESVAGALTGISLVPSGATGGVITVSANKDYPDIWNYYRWWISQFANKTSNDTWTCTGGTLNTGSWTLVVNSGVTLSDSANITKLKTLGTVTLNGTAKIEALYESVLGQSTTWTFSTVEADSSIVIYDNAGATKYFQAVTTAGDYKYYIAPQATGETYTFAVEKYSFKREQGSFMSNAGGNIGYVPDYAEDIGITDTFSNVQAYTTITTTNQIYDATAVFRLSETGIKLGQLVARDGTYLDFGTYNVKFKDDNSTLISYLSGTITYKALVVNDTTKFNAMKATPPATITATDTEQINVLIEDANGDSLLVIAGGDNLGYELWKVPDSAPVNVDPTTGTLLDTLATYDESYRFIGISGFDIIGVDLSSGVKRRTSMLKGSYKQEFYVGNQIQLDSQAIPLLDLIDQLQALQLKVDTDLDVKVSTRATQTSVDTKPTLAEMEAHTSNIAKQDKLTAIESTIGQFAGTEFETMTDSLEAISNKVDAGQAISSENFCKVYNDIDTVNEGLKNASLLIPHDEDINFICTSAVYNFDVDSSDWTGAGIIDQVTFESVLGVATDAFVLDGNNIKANILSATENSLDLSNKSITEVNYITVPGIVKVSLNANSLTLFNPSQPLPTSLVVLKVGSNVMTTAGYTASEPWANEMHTAPLGGAIDFGGNTDSVSGTNLETILINLGWAVTT